MKNKYSINGVRYDMGDNSQFAGYELRDRLNAELAKISKKYPGGLQNRSFRSSTGYDSYSFHVRVYLRDLFGNDGLSYYSVHCSIRLGKGKKNLAANSLELFPSIYFGGTVSDKEYEAALRPVKNGIKSRLPDETFDFADPSELAGVLAERLYDMDDRMRRLLKDEWIRVHDEQTTRAIDFIEYVSEIKEIFETAGAAGVKVEEENSLDKGSIVINPTADDMIGRLELVCTDGRWRIESATYIFSFVSEVFNIESGYRVKRYIRDGKLMEVVKVIAEEYARQDRIRSEFRKVSADYMEDIENNE